MKSYPILACLGTLVFVTLGAGFAEASISLHPGTGHGTIFVQVGIL